VTQTARSAAVEEGPDFERSAAQDGLEAAGPNLAHASNGHGPESGAGQNRARPALACALPPIDACRALAAAVLHCAVTDALAPPSRDKKRRAEQEKARQWLIEGGARVAFWCTLAGFDPEAVRSRLAVRLGQRPGVDE